MREPNVNGPPTRSGPATRTAIRQPGLTRFVSQGVQSGYSEAEEIATSVEAETDLPDFETGWMWYYEHGDPRPHPVAFLRPWHEGWYDLYHFRNWVGAVSCALALTKARPGCAYVGGPSA